MAYYGCGHDHFNSYQAIAGTAAVDNGTYRIIAVDGDHVASSVEHVGAWTVGLFTNPVYSEFALGSQFQTDSSAPVSNAVRCLAWDPAGIARVDWRLTYKNGSHTA